MKTPTLLAIVALTMAASAAEPKLTPVYMDDTYQFTGVAISKNGRMFVNYPRWEGKIKHSLVEVSNNVSRPYPDQDWNEWSESEAGTNQWVCVQAVWIDEQEQLWVVDPAAPGMKGVHGKSAKLVQIDLRTDKVARVYNLTETVGPQSYLNDVRIDHGRQTAYLTESKNGGIVVLNTASGQARLVLGKHYSVKSDPMHKLGIDGKEVMRNGQLMKVHADGIALSPNRELLYFKPLSDTKLYCVNTDDLLNESLTTEELGTRVQDLGSRFRTSDGMIFDGKGNLYLSDIEHNAVVRVTPDLQVEPVVTHRDLIWPDSFAWAPDGMLLVTCSQIQNMAASNGGVSTRKSPYVIYKFKVPVSPSRAAAQVDPAEQ